MSSRYVSNRKAATEAIDKEIEAYLRDLGNKGERFIQAKFREPKTGRVYGAEQRVTFVSGSSKNYGTVVGFTANRGKVLGGKGRKGSKVHRASAPGEAPAIWHAMLTKSIRSIVTKLGSDWSLIIGVTKQGGRGSPQGATGKSIAEDLEFGTKRMKPRPVFRPDLDYIKSLVTSRK